MFRTLLELCVVLLCHAPSYGWVAPNVPRSKSKNASSLYDSNFAFLLRLRAAFPFFSISRAPRFSRDSQRESQCSPRRISIRYLYASLHFPSSSVTIDKDTYLRPSSVKSSKSSKSFDALENGENSNFRNFNSKPLELATPLFEFSIVPSLLARLVVQRRIPLGRSIYRTAFLDIEHFGRWETGRDATRRQTEHSICSE